MVHRLHITNNKFISFKFYLLAHIGLQGSYISIDQIMSMEC